MKKGTKRIIIMMLLAAVLLTGCTPSISDDTYEIMNIFPESRVITFERTENETSTDVVYQLDVEGNIVSTSVEINFTEGQFRSESVFNADTLVPVSAHKGNSYTVDPAQNWDIFAEYGDVLNMTANTPEETEMKTVELPERYVDNEALLFTMGALKYEEGFQKDINISIIDAGEVITFRVSYKGLETVEVPAGTYECIKVEVKYTGIVLGAKPKMYMWYTNDNQRIPVKYENRGILLELKDVS